METLFFILCILGYLAVGVLVGGLWGHALGYAEYDPVPEALAVTLAWPLSLAMFCLAVSLFAFGVFVYPWLRQRMSWPLDFLARWYCFRKESVRAPVGVRAS
jgi:predicted lysophospholipase L1 biosynthesis ABC-type transport system permease subunit